MVKVSAVLCGVLACGLVDPCLAGDDKTTTVITYPIYHEWNEGSSNMTVTLGVINADYAWQHANNTLDKRTGITITQVVTTIKNGAQNIATVKAAKDIYDFIAGIIKSKADVSSCAITYGTDAGDGLVYGYAYQTTTTGSNCGSTAEKKTIVDAWVAVLSTMVGPGTVTYD
ncbi:uncharacterized protein N7529_008502 [Penicillium soppii]|uniref:uncharacterized protein n=1 Tax=Penicillium soppii TaxID=69789 RepID=UPI0025485E8B|nr:uncharacterized protein N7529_008502 [Penicillium soppii]KAJ5861192.1 hypothetical protein N7529_008502 [Penicillium soppii]